MFILPKSNDWLSMYSKTAWFLSQICQCKDGCHRRNNCPFVFQSCKRRKTKCRVQSRKWEMYMIPQSLRLAEALMPICFSYSKYKLQGVDPFSKCIMTPSPTKAWVAPVFRAYYRLWYLLFEGNIEARKHKVQGIGWDIRPFAIHCNAFHELDTLQMVMIQCKSTKSILILTHGM